MAYLSQRYAIVWWKTLILVIVPIKSADKFKNEQSKGTLFLVKRPLLKNSPSGCFVNSQHCLKGKKQCTIALKIAIALVNVPQGHFLRSRLRQGIFAHCGERPKALPLETASIFEKLLDQKTFRFKISKDFFDKLSRPFYYGRLFL